MADDILNTVATTGLLGSDGSVRGSLEAPGDQDWFRVELQAGTDYRFWISGTGPNADLNVSFHLYDAAGADTGESFNEGGAYSDFYYDWIPAQSGTYYASINSNDGSTGDYTVALNQITDSPLDAIDWGTKVATSAIKVYFAHAGQTYSDLDQGDMPAADLTPYEQQQVLAAYREYSRFADLSFNPTSDEGSANLKFVLTDTGLANTETFGFYEPPGTVDEGLGVVGGASNTFWNPTPGGSIEKGGRDWSKLLHEIGHALGMAHPHDTGGASEVMHGVTQGAATGDYGDFDLNQGIYTVMSYNTGWETAPQGTPQTSGGNLDRTYGWMGTPMALDIAVIQAKYGANMSYNTGNNTYTLPDLNGSGTFYSCIWDAGGTDTVRAGGTTANCTIDLRAATLLYEEGGGGWVSYQAGIFGGFTIAHSVVIENAAGAGGNDTLTGNAAANRLDGGTGADTMRGSAGNDTYLVDNTGDVVDETGGSGKDTVRSGVNFSLSDTEHVTGAIETLVLTGHARKGTGSGVDDTIDGNSGKNTLVGLGGHDVLDGREGRDSLKGGDGADRLIGGGGADRLDAGEDSGRDIFVYRAKTDSGTLPKHADRLFNFHPHEPHEKGSDKIDVSEFDTDKHEKRDQPFRFVDQFSPAHGKHPDGEIALQDHGKSVDVLIDVNGDQQADMLIRVMDVKALHEADFIL